MKLEKLKIITRFKNLHNFEIDFSSRQGITVVIGNNASGKSNLLEAISWIFAGLYDSTFKPNFDYELSYRIDDSFVEVKFTNGEYDFKVNGHNDNIKINYLPSQIISSYSGEDDRLWKNYYSPFYQTYTRAIRGATIPNSRLIYINKYYWNIALLVLHFYDFSIFTDIKSFCKEKLKIEEVNFIKIRFDIQKLNDFLERNPNLITAFILNLNPEKKEEILISLDEFKERVGHLREIELFRYLSLSYMPKDEKLITDIEIIYNDNLNAESFSEGEKKLLLIVCILEVLGDENSLILLDEPDSHIHLSRKGDISKLLMKFSNRENIITTHSPTLAHNFDLRHIAMLTKNINDESKIEEKEKQEIIHELTKGVWSYQEQNIFLNSRNDILLIEGKSDETFLSKALSVLKQTDERYADLEFEYLPCGGAEGVKLMTQKFTPKIGQHIIALFDCDNAGWTSINKIFERTGNNKFNSSNFPKYKKQGNIWITTFPIRPYYQGGSNFNIEDYFSKKLLNKYILRSFKGLDSIVTKENLKRALERECSDFPDEEFKFFKFVFDLILEIKTK
uniref:ATP-dependent nuclease n=1 Tax=uncultured Dysgonomonas sp. TaxID=206096 RepID=UPI00258E5A48|nr:ATP-binding protein [uncultured Dysgonomonas sp.]